MVEQGSALQWHWVWNDECASQFKSNKPWYFVSQYPNMARVCKIHKSLESMGQMKLDLGMIHTIGNIFLRAIRYFPYILKKFLI